MTVYAIVENGVVINTVVWDGNAATWSPPDGTTAQPLSDGSPVCVGYAWNGSTYTAPAAPAGAFG